MPSRRDYLRGVGAAIAAGGLAGCGAVPAISSPPEFARPLYAPSGGKTDDEPYPVRASRPSVVEAHADYLGSTPDWNYLSTPPGVDPARLDLYVGFGEQAYAVGGETFAALGPFSADAVADASSLARDGRYRGFDVYRYTKEGNPADAGIVALAIADGVAFGSREIEYEEIAGYGDGEGTAPTVRGTLSRLRRIVDAWTGAAERYGDVVPGSTAIFRHLEGATSARCNAWYHDQRPRSRWSVGDLLAAGQGIRLEGRTFVETIAYRYDRGAEIDERAVRTVAQRRYLRRLGDQHPRIDGEGAVPGDPKPSIDLPIEYERDGRFVAVRWQGPTSELGD